MDLSSVNFILTIGSLAILRTVGIWDFARGATANEAPYPPPSVFRHRKPSATAKHRPILLVTLIGRGVAADVIRKVSQLVFDRDDGDV